MRRILVDAGPLVAILSEADEYHDACVDALRGMPVPLLTCWPVVTEAAWLLRRFPRAVHQLLQSLDSGFLELMVLSGSEAESITSIMKRYEQIRPQLADAALVYLAQREQIDTVFTLDQRDFSIYRTNRRRPFRILPAVE